MSLPALHQQAGYQYLDEGQGTPLLCLHGLFGALSNWQDVIEAHQASYRVIVPLLPLHLPGKVHPSLEGLTQYVADFAAMMDLKAPVVLGNSLGGHVALMYALMHPDRVKALVLTGSSGLFENTMGMGFMRRNDPVYMRERVEYTFYDPRTATDELFDEVFRWVLNRDSALRLITLAKAAQRMNMQPWLHQVQQPTCLIWGLNDNITPTYVAHEFCQNIPHAELHFIDKCGHAPMMEQPKAFNGYLSDFLNRLAPPVPVHHGSPAYA